MRREDGAGRLRGFTLVEMLVVITVISLLVSLLAPALGRARELSQAVGCGNNLRQLGMAQMQYVEAYNGSFTPTGGWSTLYPQGWYRLLNAALNAEGLFCCPQMTGFGFSEWSLGCGLNFEPQSINRNTAVRLAQVRRPSQKFLTADCDKGTWDFFTCRGGDPNYPVGTRHSSGTPVLWVDGHVDSQNPPAVFYGGAAVWFFRY